MIEVRFHGRGGQGAVTGTQVLANAFVKQGKFGSSFPMFGFERRGAPVTAYMRFNEKPIRVKTQIYNPDCLVVLDPGQKDSTLIYEGLKPKGVLIMNSSDEINEKPHANVRLAGVVDAEAIALEELGMPLPNTCMLGAFAAVTKWIPLDYVLSSIEQYFTGVVLERNIRTVKRGYKEVKVQKW